MFQELTADALNGMDAAWNITVQWLAGDLACRLLMFLKLVAMYSCAFVTVVISLDRQSAILNPLAINKAKKKNKVMLSVAWVMSFVLSVPQVRSCLSDFSCFSLCLISVHYSNSQEPAESGVRNPESHREIKMKMTGS
ncbi:hypothetical protein PO909_031958 [Leuciscus waleckii]